MLESQTLTAHDLLGALEGVVYVVDPDGLILACGQRSWDSFVEDNDGPADLKSERVIGRSLFSFIKGEEVVAQYRSWLLKVRDEYSGPLTFCYRCDSPSVRREMRMSITRLESKGELCGFLFQSILLDARQRPPLNLYDFDAQLAWLRRGKAMPLVRMCSFCQTVHWEPDEERSAGEWISAEQYYGRGGVSEVQITHGICPACAETFLAAGQGSSSRSAG